MVKKERANLNMSLQASIVGGFSPAAALLKLAAGNRGGLRVSPEVIVKEARANAPHLATVAGRVLSPGNDVARVRLRPS